GVQLNPWKGALMLALWAPINYFLVRYGYAQLPFISLALGLIGATAVLRLSALLSLGRVFQPLRYCGEHSIVIYLAFFLPMAVTRIVLLKTGIVADLGAVSLLVTAVGVVGALCWYWAVRGTRFCFLFERPAWARMRPARV